MLKGFLREGKKCESEFAKCLTRNFGGTTEPSSRKEDINGHIDLYWNTPNGARCSFDVKGMRKDGRGDDKVSAEHTWVEFRNVYGGKGSLYGEQDYFAFEVEDRWVIIRRNVLADLCENRTNINHVVHENPREDFICYQRFGRKDLIMRIPMSLITDYSCKMIMK